MKYLLLLILSFFSCQKHIIPTDSVKGPIQLSQATLASRVWQLKHVGKYSDTCATARNGNCILFIGDSYHERMLYSSWASTWAGRPVLNRAIGGTTCNEQQPYIDSLITCYTPKVIVMSVGNNEYLRFAGTNPTNRDGARIFLPPFNRYYDTIRAHNPQAKIVVMAMLTCPKLAVRNWNGDISLVTNKYPIGYPTPNSLSLREKVTRDGGVYVDLRANYPSNNMGNFETDSIHPHLNSYPTKWYPRIKQVVDSLYNLP